MRVSVEQWNQFGGNPAGSGFRAVNSIAAVDPPTWFIQTPSDIGIGSPVVGVDGTVYVGTIEGSGTSSCRDVWRPWRSSGRWFFPASRG